LRTPEAELKRVGRARYDNLELIWDYDAMPPLQALNIPQLWVLAGADREAPPEIPRQRLSQLKAQGKPIDLFVFPDTDHGIFEFEQAADGSRRMTRVADGYFRLVADWIRGGVKGPYGRAEHIP
jgi:pimeloyl-ACP methyl ester carboxylesterase